MSISVPSEIFRAYDIRGVVETTLTPEVIYLIGLSIGSEAIDRGYSSIIVARDGRVSGPQLMQSLIQGLNESGCDVIDLGCAPTPLLYFATFKLASQSGVMLTGSHNPPNYNGLKIVLGGETLSGQSIWQLYQRIQKQDFHRRDNGGYQQLSIIDDYIAELTQGLSLQRRLKIVVDCGNGIAGAVAPQLFRQLNCDVTELYCEVDGSFPNHHPDPSDPSNLQDLIKAVKAVNADVGLAFDGDGDRIGVVTNKGEIIWPDRQMMLYAIDVLTHHAGATILYDVKCSNQLADVIREYQGQALMWKTGHSFIKSKMRETAALLAGEMSGHIFFKDRWYGFDDALYCAARLLEILSKQNKTSSEIFSSLPNAVNTPELKMAISDDKKFDFIKRLVENANFVGGTISTLDGLRVDYKECWGLIRPSNTTPSLVMRFEGQNSMALQRIQDLFRQQLLAIDKSLLLPF